MVETKFVIDQGLAEDGILVLNADDNKIVKYAQYITHEICWFSLDSSNQTVVEHIKKGNRACILEDDKIVYYRNGKKFILIDYHQIPLTINGAAVYNISNSLGAVALAKSLDIESEHIINSLSEFGNSNDDNPGRANIYNKNGMTILLDFAHNPHGMDALAKLVNNISANRKILLIGQVGDRSNEDIANLINSAAKINPDKVIISEIVNYLRGREVGEIPALITQSFKNNDISEDAMIYSDDMLAGVKKSLEIAEEGDLLILLCLDQKKEILQFIKNEID
jgi:UDP-N-acetylmuramyl tripeptide synthase